MKYHLLIMMTFKILQLNPLVISKHIQYAKKLLSHMQVSNTLCTFFPCIIWESEDGFFSSRGIICETIARDSRNPISKTCHKILQDNQREREFPTKLVIPATKFTAEFSKLGYLGIKIMTDKSKVKYSRVSIVQAYKPK